MAIEAGWDPDMGAPLPASCSGGFEESDEPEFELPGAAELAWWASIDRAAPIGECLWDDEPEPELAGPGAERESAAEPGWAVPGVSEEEPSGEGLSGSSLALLAELDDAVTGWRLAGARVYRAFTVIRASHVLAESGYRKLAPLLEDHVRLDRATITKLDRHAEALHDTVTPSGATSPAALPATAAAVEDGTVDAEHVEVIDKTMQRLRAVASLEDGVLGVAEEQLAALAATHSPKRLFAAAKVIADRLDPDGAAPVDDAPAGNELHYSRRRNGHLHAKLVLRDPAGAALFDDAVRAATPAPAAAAVADPDTGAAPVGEDGVCGQDPVEQARETKPARQAGGLLDLIAASHRAGLDHTDTEQHPDRPTASMPLPDLDHPDTTSPTTSAGVGLEDPLPGNGTPFQNQRPDEATDGATDADEPTEEPPLFGPGAPEPAPGPSEPPPHRPWTPPEFDAMALPGRERVTLTVTVDYQTLRQQLTDTSQALALLGDSTLIRPDTARRLACDADIIPIVLGAKGEVLDVGRKTRAIPTATGRAVTTRDRHCAFPGCRRKTRTSEIHHIVHWAHHGPTEPDNLVCLCRYHHDLVHHSGWDVLMIDHQPWFRPPHWLDPTRTLRHNRPWQVMPT